MSNQFTSFLIKKENESREIELQGTRKCHVSSNSEPSHVTETGILRQTSPLISNEVRP